MNFQEQYDALVRADPAYEGRFITGVKTTGIFCRPTCRAPRKPKAENVEFFPSAREALLAGYRPCKLCSPMEPKEPIPGMIRAPLDEVEAKPGQRIRDDQVRARGMDPGTVRRWFKKHHQMTFQGYQRARRLGMAFGRIRQGQSVAEAALGSGFDSLSAFGDSFKKAFGSSPTKTAAQRLIFVTRIATPLGLMVAAALDEGLCLLEFADRRALETELTDLERLLEARCLSGTSEVLVHAAAQLDEYFAGSRTSFDLPLVQPGTPFDQAAWEALQAVGYGQTSTYSSQAAKLGHPAAVRAVGHANGRNRIAIVVPCHRLVTSGGKLAGYGGGLWRKRWLLDHEAGCLVTTGAKR